MSRPPHRKRVKHLDLPGVARFLTFSCYQHRPLLTSDEPCAPLSRALDAACDRHQFHIAAFAFMPDHVHLLVLPLSDSSSVSRLLFAIKRPFSYRYRMWLEANDPASLNLLMVRERPNKTAFRWWQEGSGHDRDVLETEGFWETVDYIHANPVEAGLCALERDWLWSSWHWWQQRTQHPLLPKMRPLPADWT